MSTTTLTKTARLILGSALQGAGSTLAATGTAAGVLDVRTGQGGVLHIRIVNGATGPTTAAVAQVLHAPTDSTTPSAAAAGNAWKVFLDGLSGGTSNNGDTAWAIEVPAAIQHLQVRITGNTGQSVTVEAHYSEITNAVTVA